MAFSVQLGPGAGRLEMVADFVVNSHGFLNAPMFYVQSPEMPKFGAGDWLVKKGIPDHHLRVIEPHTDHLGNRFYLVFETSLRDKLSGFRYRNAEQLESTATWKMGAGNDLDGILDRARRACGIEYSILAHTDCESLQRWIQTGKEEDRWSTQVWWALGFGGLGLFFFGSN
jgi:hypothetical protein